MAVSGEGAPSISGEQAIQTSVVANLRAAIWIAIDEPDYQ